jgi:hypothetical protein
MIPFVPNILLRHFRNNVHPSQYSNFNEASTDIRSTSVRAAVLLADISGFSKLDVFKTLDKNSLRNEKVVREAFEGEMNSYLENTLENTLEKNQRAPNTIRSAGVSSNDINSQDDERGIDTTMDKFETLTEGIKAAANLILEPVKKTWQQKGWFLKNIKHLERLANVKEKAYQAVISAKGGERVARQADFRKKNDRFQEACEKCREDFWKARARAAGFG